MSDIKIQINRYHKLVQDSNWEYFRMTAKINVFCRQTSAEFTTDQLESVQNDHGNINVAVRFYQ